MDHGSEDGHSGLGFSCTSSHFVGFITPRVRNMISEALFLPPRPFSYMDADASPGTVRAVPGASPPPTSCIRGPRMSNNAYNMRDLSESSVWTWFDLSLRDTAGWLPFHAQRPANGGPAVILSIVDHFLVAASSQVISDTLPAPRTSAVNLHRHPCYLIPSGRLRSLRDSHFCFSR